MTHARGLRSLRNCRFRALIAGLALLLLVLGLSGVRSTMAGWTSSGEAKGSFATGSLNISGLTCRDSGLTGGLLANQVKLEWSAPPGSDSEQVVYQIIAKKKPLIGTETTTTDYRVETSYTYTDGRLLALANYEFTVQGQTKSGGWKGSSATVKASALLVPVAMRCKK